MIEVDCRECINCTGDSCIPFGKDANIATKKCAADGFRNYVTKSELDKCEMRSKIDDLQRNLTEYIANPTSRSPLNLSSIDATLCCLGLELLKK